MDIKIEKYTNGEKHKSKNVSDESIEDIFRNRVLLKRKIDKNGKYAIRYIDTNLVYKEKIYISKDAQKRFEGCIEEIEKDGLRNEGFTIFTIRLPEYVQGEKIHIGWFRSVLKHTPLESDIYDIFKIYNCMVTYNGNIDKIYELTGIDFERLTSTDKVIKNVLGSDITNAMNYFVQRIDRPVFERYSDNTNKNTFDIVRIKIYIPTEKDWNSNIQSFYISESRKEFAINNKKYLVELALNKIQNTKKWEKYNIPITILKLDKLTITCDSSLDFIFTIKDFNSVN